MATLTNTDFQQIQTWVRSHPIQNGDIKTWGLSRQTYQTAIQTIEDYMVNGFTTRPATSIRAAVEAVTGATTVARVRALFEAWAAWKTRSLG